MSNKVAEIVTDTIIKKLESGNIPWVKPWEGGEAVNYVTQEAYRGINRLLLDGGEYATFKQITERGGKIKKGARSSIVVFYKPLVYDNSETETMSDQEEEKKVVRYLRYYRVFSIEDVEGLESKQTLTERPNYEIKNCQDLMDNYINKEGIKLKNLERSAKAYYEPSTDAINLPIMCQFRSSEDYYATAFHEMAHSTGHKNRLDRLSKTTHFGNKEYSREELVAEITSAMICRHTGIDSVQLIDNTVAYIQSWLQALKNDKGMVLAASAKAEKAYSYILGE